MEYRVGWSARGNAPKGDRKPDRMLRSLLSPSQSSGLPFPSERSVANGGHGNGRPTYLIPLG